MKRLVLILGMACVLGFDATAVEPARIRLLIDTLRDPSPSYRRSAARELGKIGAPAKEAAPALADCLSDRELGVRRAALEALASIGPEAQAAVPALFHVVNYAPHPEAKAAQAALRKIEPTDAGVLVVQLGQGELARDLAATRLVHLGAKAVPDLIKGMRSDRSDVQRNSIHVLETIIAETESTTPPFHELVEKLVGAMGKGAPHEPDVATSLLVEIGEPAVPALIEALDRPNGMYAVWTLGMIGPEAKAAIPALTRMSQGANPLTAQRALERIGPARSPAEGVGQAPSPEAAVPRLVNLLDTGFSRFAAEGLGQLGPAAKSALPQLKALMRVRPTWRSMDAAAAVWRISGDDEAVSKLLDGLHDEWDEHRSYAATLLGQLGAPAKTVVPELVNALDDPSPQVRVAAARALGSIGKDAVAAAPKLIALASNVEERSKVRDAAAKALRTIDPKAAEKLSPR